MESKKSEDRINFFLTFNRKIHIHLGLFLLLFIWLFSISGLIINNGKWKFASFYEQRQESKTDFTLPIATLNDKTDPSKTPNWIVTNIWRLSMDLIAIILIILCLSSWLMWYKVRRDYRLGYFALGIGSIVAGYYIFLLDFM